MVLSSWSAGVGHQPFPERGQQGLVQRLAGVGVVPGVHQEAPGGAVRPGLLVGRGGEVVVGRLEVGGDHLGGGRAHVVVERGIAVPGGHDLPDHPGAVGRVGAARVRHARGQGRRQVVGGIAALQGGVGEQRGDPALVRQAGVVGDLRRRGGVVGDEEGPGRRRVVPEVAEQPGQGLVLRRRVVIGAAGGQQGDGEESRGRPPAS